MHSKAIRFPHQIVFSLLQYALAAAMLKFRIQSNLIHTALINDDSQVCGMWASAYGLETQSQYAVILQAL